MAHIYEWDGWVFDPNLAAPPTLYSEDPDEIEERVSQQLEGKRHQNLYLHGSPAQMNAVGVAPRVWMPSEQRWHDVRDEANDAGAYGDHADGGKVWNVTPAWKLDETEGVRSRAFEYLIDYYLRYSRSQFEWNGHTYAANTPDAEIRLLKGMVRHLASMVLPATPDPSKHPAVAIDINKEPHRLTTFQQYRAFYIQYDDLDTTAEGLVEPAWRDVRQATTAQAIVDRINQLPKVPGE